MNISSSGMKKALLTRNILTGPAQVTSDLRNDTYRMKR
jgi:hypothetical protein